MRIRFLSDQIYDQGGPGKGPRFPAGFVLDAAGVKDALGLQEEPTKEFCDAFLNRWLQRRVAAEVDGRSPPSDTDLAAANAGAPLPDLDPLSRKDLDALAAARGVDVSAAKTKADVIAALKASAS